MVIRLAWGTYQWRALLYTVMNPSVAQKARNFLNGVERVRNVRQDLVFCQAQVAGFFSYTKCRGISVGDARQVSAGQISLRVGENALGYKI